MPELPEVEIFRRQIETPVQNKTVTDVDVRPDSIVFCGKSPAAVKKVFFRMKIKKCLRKGKYVWLELSQKPWPVFHLGMKGSYILSKCLPETTSKSIKLVLQMHDGTFFIFKDPRRFARMFLMDNPLAAKPLGYLGPNVLTELPSPNQLQALLGSRKAPIKSLIFMNQALLAGIGNWMADEFFFKVELTFTEKLTS